MRTKLGSISTSCPQSMEQMANSIIDRLGYCLRVGWRVLGWTGLRPLLADDHQGNLFWSLAERETPWFIGGDQGRPQFMDEMDAELEEAGFDTSADQFLKK